MLFFLEISLILFFFTPILILYFFIEVLMYHRIIYKKINIKKNIYTFSILHTCTIFYYISIYIFYIF